MVRTAHEQHASIAEAVRREIDRYAHGKDRPLPQYAGIMAVNAAATGGIALAFRRSGRPLPGALTLGDVLATALTTQRISRLLTKDTVTSPLRAPFARYEGAGGPAELTEDVRGTGWRKAIGELMTCPFCMAHWVATGIGVGWLFAPRATRLVTRMFAALAIADASQFGYAALQRSERKG